jgi:hypothetical protein
MDVTTRRQVRGGHRLEVPATRRFFRLMIARGVYTPRVPAAGGARLKLPHQYGTECYPARPYSRQPPKPEISRPSTSWKKYRTVRTLLSSSRQVVALPHGRRTLYAGRAALPHGRRTLYARRAALPRGRRTLYARRAALPHGTCGARAAPHPSPLPSAMRLPWGEGTGLWRVV